MTPLEKRIHLSIMESGLSQSEIARRTGAARSAVIKWQKSGQISTHYLQKLCIALNLNINELMFGNDKEQPTPPTPLKPLQIQVIAATRNISNEHYYKLETVLELLKE